eukprot:4042290-Karenia_brevis.AAC.1
MRSSEQLSCGDWMRASTCERLFLSSMPRTQSAALCMLWRMACSEPTLTQRKGYSREMGPPVHVSVPGYTLKCRR